MIKVRDFRRKIGPGLMIFGYVMMVIGIVTFVSWLVKWGNFIFSDERVKTKYEDFIASTVMTDPIPFDDVTKANNDFILEASLWSILNSDEVSKYSKDEFGLSLIPASDVAVAARKLFGPEVAITHETFDDADATYLYDEEISSYRIPKVSKMAYSPKIVEIIKNGTERKLKVGYIAPGNMWSTFTEDRKTGAAPEKYMYYYLTKGEDKEYYISEIESVSKEAIS